MLSKKIYFGVSLFIFFVAGVTLHKSGQNKKLDVINKVDDFSLVVDSNKLPLTKKNLENKKKLHNLSKIIFSKIDEKKPLPKLGEVELKQRMLVGFQRMHMSAGKFNSAAFVKAEINELLKSPEAIDIAQNSLLSLDYAKNNFGKDQAIARVYSIKLLDELAKQGEPYALYDTTRKLAEILDQQAASNQEFINRQEYDLEDLVYASINTFDESQVVEHPQTVLSEVGYDDNKNNKIKKIYANLFGVVFERNSSVDEAIDKVQLIFRGEGKV